MTSLDRNDRAVINLLFVLPILFYLNILETERLLQFSNKIILVVPAQVVKHSDERDVCSRDLQE